MHRRSPSLSESQPAAARARGGAAGRGAEAMRCAAHARRGAGHSGGRMAVKARCLPGFRRVPAGCTGSPAPRIRTHTGGFWLRAKPPCTNAGSSCAFAEPFCALAKSPCTSAGSSRAFAEPSRALAISSCANTGSPCEVAEPSCALAESSGTNAGSPCAFAEPFRTATKSVYRKASARAKGPHPYQPGATPQVPGYDNDKGLKARAMMLASVDGSGFQPSFIVQTRVLGRCPRLAWVAPLAHRLAPLAHRLAPLALRPPQTFGTHSGAACGMPFPTRRAA